MRAGDQAARTRLVEHACQRLRELAQRMLRRFHKVHRWEETDDVFAEAMVRLHRSLAGVQLESARHFYNLAAAQIRRVLIDMARKHFGPEGVGANQESQLRGSESQTERADCQAVDRSEPADLLQWAEFHERIDRLPAEEREVFGLLWYDGLSQADAAAILNTSVRTIKRRWQTARFLIAEGFEEPPPA
jgi:RNA polymerase sigma-70 factor (ECF subfamily)